MIFDSRFRNRAFLVCLFLSLVYIAAPRQEARGGGSTETQTTATDPATAVELGAQQERARHWIDAIDVYERAIKRWPEDKDLKYGLRRSKIQFGIERRYDDVSFERTLLHLPRYAALDLFNEVFEQIRLFYVDEVSPTSFVAHGTESLYIALGNEKFLARNLRGVDQQRIAQMRRMLRERFWNRPISDYSLARNTVSEVCDLAASQLGLSDTAVILEYVFGGCNCLDEYSNFLTRDRLADLYGNINGEFVGLGIEMKAESGKGMFLVNVLPESPAEEGGLHAGDYITRIDGTNCENMSTDEAARLLRGKQGTRVTLMVQDPDQHQAREGQFVRRAVEVKSVPVAKIIDRNKGIAYLRMTGFQLTTPREIDTALAKLSREGMRALIWDLRGNPGGLLTTATTVLDRFIDSGVLVTTKGRASGQNQLYSATPHPKFDIPLALLVDGDSASASEIVAGAIHDHKRGSIIGRKTYGKWSVQSIYHMPNDTGLRLTTAKFYSPRGHNLSKIGVVPDVVVDLESRTTVYKPSVTGNGQGTGEQSANVPQVYAPRNRTRSIRNNPSVDDPDIKAALGVLEHQVQMTGR